MKNRLIFPIVFLLGFSFCTTGASNENSVYSDEENHRGDDHHHGHHGKERRVAFIETSTTSSTTTEGPTTTDVTPSRQPPAMSRGRGELLRFMFKYYDKRNFPSHIVLTFGMQLMGLEYDEKTKQLGIDTWLDLKWNDPRFQWNPFDFGERSLHVPGDDIWKPDIALYNARDPKRTYRCMESGLVIRHTGDIRWVPACYMVPRCRLNFESSPYTVQNCTLKFGSWTHHGHQIDLELKSDKLDLSQFDGGEEWKLVGDQKLHRVEKFYPSHTEPYYEIRVDLVFRRKIFESDANDTRSTTPNHA